MVGRAAAAPAAWDWNAARRRCVREAQRMLDDPVAAEDAAQEALLRAWRQRDACRNREAPEGWIVQIARNEALRLAGRTRMRAEREVHSPDDVPGLESGTEPEAQLDALDLQRALSCMSAQERALLTLRYCADLAQPDLARSLDVPEGTIRVRLHRARKRLRRAMEAQA
jgi:RNA polymerase sigma-70 factor (ECF subfamily)